MAFSNEDTFNHLLPWAPLTFAAAHIVEEFVLPGGFASWYQTYRGPSVTTIRPRFLIVINAVLLALCWNAAVAAHDAKNIPFWLGVSAILSSNGIWHLWAATRTRSYSPGTVTGLLLYIPLTLYGLVHFVGFGQVPLGSALLAVLIGGSYALWSVAFHRRNRSAA